MMQVSSTAGTTPTLLVPSEIHRLLRKYAKPTVVDAYNDAPLEASLCHLAPVLRAGAAILDLGCGEGALTASFAKQGLRAYGIDLDVQRLQLARARVTGSTRAALAKANAESLPFADAQFDAVISISVLQYVDWRQVVRECSRVLRPGGRAAFLENLRGHPLARAYRVVRRLAWAYPQFQTPRGHIDWDEATDFRTNFPGAELTAYHLASAFLLMPHALKESRPARFSRLGHRSFQVLNRLDSALLRRWPSLSRSGWLFTALCTKPEQNMEET